MPFIAIAVRFEMTKLFAALSVPLFMLSTAVPTLVGAIVRPRTDPRMTCTPPFRLSVAELDSVAPRIRLLTDRMPPVWLMTPTAEPPLATIELDVMKISPPDWLTVPLPVLPTK